MWALPLSVRCARLRLTPVGMISSRSSLLSCAIIIAV